VSYRKQEIIPPRKGFFEINSTIDEFTRLNTENTNIVLITGFIQNLLPDSYKTFNDPILRPRTPLETRTLTSNILRSNILRDILRSFLNPNVGALMDIEPLEREPFLGNITTTIKNMQNAISFIRMDKRISQEETILTIDALTQYLKVRTDATMSTSWGSSENKMIGTLMAKERDSNTGFNTMKGTFLFRRPRARSIKIINATTSSTAAMTGTNKIITLREKIPITTTPMAVSLSHKRTEKENKLGVYKMNGNATTKKSWFAFYVTRGGVLR
jgi:hypothetical protein